MTKFAPFFAKSSCRVVAVWQPPFWVSLELTPAATPFPLPVLWHPGLLCDVFINLVLGMGFPAGKRIHWANISFLFPPSRLPPAPSSSRRKTTLSGSTFPKPGNGLEIPSRGRRTRSSSFLHKE